MAKKTAGYDLLIQVLENNYPSKMTGVPPRDSDKELLIQMMQFSGAELSAEQMAVVRKFNFESLTRARRKLQEAGQYMPSAEIAKRRRLKSYEAQQVAPKETAAGLQRRLEEN